MSVSMKHAHSYGAYLNSPEWKERRREALIAADFRCQACEADEQLEVHHLTYERLGFEHPRDLMVLCNGCHAFEHGRSPKNVPMAGPTLSETAVANRRRYWWGRQQEEELIPEALTRGQRDAILRVYHAVFELPEGALRKRLRRYIADNKPIVQVLRSAELREEIARHEDGG